MNYPELLSFVGINRLEVKDCRINLSLTVIDGKPNIQVEVYPESIDGYNEIGRFLGESDIEFYESLYEPNNLSISHFEIDASLKLFLTWDNEEGNLSTKEYTISYSFLCP